jgi:hypothetical protein
MSHNDPRPARNVLTTPGQYRIKLRKPKADFVHAHDDGTVSSRLWFETVDGSLYFTKTYGTRYAGSLAMLVGKFSGRFTEALPEQGVTPDEFIRFLAPACDLPLDVEITTAPVIDKATGLQAEYKGVPKFSYSLRFPKFIKPNESDVGGKVNGGRMTGGEAIEF